MSLFRLFGPALLLAIATASCGSTTEAPVDSTRIPEAEFCDAYATRICGVYSPCCAQIGHRLDEEQCRILAKGECQANANSARAEGRIYDAATARDCITRLDDGVVSCLIDPDIRKNIEPTCKRDVYRGSTPLGGSCQSDDDCARHPDGRTECDTHTLGATFTCVLPVSSDLAGPCLERDDNHRLFVCRRGLTCHSSHTCVSALGEGSTCAFGPERAECASPYLCMNGVCTAPPKVGEACEIVAPRVCGLDAFCNTDSGVCEALLEEGASCSDSERCESRRCKGTCQPKVELGEACDPKEGMTACSEGFCDETKLVCKALLPDHDTCTYSSQCVSRRCEGGVCVHPSFIETKICGASSGDEMPTPAP